MHFWNNFWSSRASKYHQTHKIKTKTFTINEDQLKKLEEWQSHIKAIYGSYGNYKYTFSSNGIGKNVVVYSELADTELDLTDVDSW